MSSTKPAIDFSKPVQTSEGLPVRILCADRNHDEFPVVGLIRWPDGGELVESWSLTGTAFRSVRNNLVQVRHPRKHAALIKRWADDDSVRIKRMTHFGWSEDSYPVFHPDTRCEEILPGDPLY